MSENILDYILEFLLGALYHKQDKKRSNYNFVKYTDDPKEINAAKVVIKPSGFFKAKVYGTPQSEPHLPLPCWEGIPLIFGEPYHEWTNEGKTLIIYADIIASTYYLISRYEEMYNRKVRDAYGRFPIEASLPYRANFLNRPIVDEYAKALRNLLDTQGIFEDLNLYREPIPDSPKQIHLGIDVYQPFLHQGLKRLIFRLFNRMDPYDTFNDIYDFHKTLIKNVEELIVVKTTLFLKSTGSNLSEDKPLYSLGSMKHILQHASKQGIRCGLLSSYASSQYPILIKEEASKLRQQLRKIYLSLSRSTHKQHTLEGKIRFKCFKELDIESSRHSYLALSEPEDIKEILSSGIRHDYTMGYHETIGFRLGTSRPVRFINPNTRSLSPLTMHPLTITSDGLVKLYYSLQNEKLFWCTIDSVFKLISLHNGELNLSLRNSDFNKELAPLIAKFLERLSVYFTKR